jgi:hypothetical protein
MAAYLRRILGERITALATGATDPKAIGEWVRGAGQPGPEVERRLRDAFYVAGMLMETESPQTVKAWFIGRNPQLDDRAPALVIAEDDPMEVIRAAHAYLAGAW